MAANRRTFLKATAAVAGTAALSAKSYVAAQGANDRVQVAVVGPGGMGTSHIRTLVGQRDVQITHVCDVDRNRLAAAAKNATANGQEPAQIGDMRRIFDAREVVAVFMATPDHWHAPGAILGMDAGKHVYVEKPASHNIREGRLMIDTARRTRKICQVGTQSRSTEHVKVAVESLHKNAIGEVLACRVWNSRLRGSIGRQKPSTPPAHLDYDSWVGPATMVPYQANRGHSIWRWWHHFGTGDMGNDGVHDLDIGRWGLGVQTHPTTITALGGKYFFDDDQEFPDTQTVIFEWPAEAKGGKKKQLIFEMRIWTPYRMETHENGDAWYGTNGMMVLGKGEGWKMFGPRNKELRQMAGSPNLLAHHRNFFDCIRSGERPNADIEIGHLSSTLCHLGNLAIRLGRTLRFDPKAETFPGDKEATALVSREYRDHWARPRV